MSAASSLPYTLRRNLPREVPESEVDFRSLIEPPQDRSFDLVHLWRALLKRLGVVIAIPIVVGIVVGIHELMLPDLYTASSTILIRGTTPQVFGDAGTSIQSAGNDSNLSGDPDIFLNTKYELLQTSALALKVIRAEDLVGNDAFTGAHGAHRFFVLKLLSDLKHRIVGQPTATAPGSMFTPDALVGAYLGALAVQPITGTELVRITFTTQDPGLSAQLANAHVRQFIRQGIELNSQASEEAEQFLQSKLSELKRKVEDSEAALNNYRRDKGIIPGLISVNGKEDIVLERLNKLSEQLQDAHLKTISLGARMALIKQGRADALPAVVDDGVVQKLKDRMSGLQEEYAGLAKDFKPNYPPMVALQARIADTRAAIQTEEGSVVSSIDAQYLEAQKDEQNLDEELRKQKDFALGLNDAAVRYQILAREADTNRELYNSVLKRMKDVEVTGDLHASDISIVDLAQTPGGPSSPQRMRDVMMALMVGLAGGIAVVFLLDRLDNSLKDVDEVERYLGIPSLGVIPNFLTGETSDAPSNVYALRGPYTRLLGDRRSDYSKEIVLSYGSYSAAGEAYRMLRTAFVLSRAGGPPKTALITSAVKGDGKTITAVNLAVMLAMTHKRVILVDADLRLPRCHDLFALDNFLGLTEVLTGARELKDAIRITEIEGLHLITSGEIPPNPSELLGSEKMRTILTQLEDLYDYVIIDSTPIIQTSESTLLSTLVDGVIMVARSESPKQQVRSALMRLRYARAKILGLVLNKTDTPRGGHYHYQYYSSPAREYGAGKPSTKTVGDGRTEPATPGTSDPESKLDGGAPGIEATEKRLTSKARQIAQRIRLARSAPTGTVAARMASNSADTEARSTTSASSDTALSAAADNRESPKAITAAVAVGHEQPKAKMTAEHDAQLEENRELLGYRVAAGAEASGNLLGFFKSRSPATRTETRDNEPAADITERLTLSEPQPAAETQEPSTVGFVSSEPTPFESDPTQSMHVVESTSVDPSLTEATFVESSQPEQTPAERSPVEQIPMEPSPVDLSTPHESSNWQSASEAQVMANEEVQNSPNSAGFDGRMRSATTRDLDGNAIEITKESRFSGQLRFPGTIVIHGEVEGEIDALRVIIREGGSVTARISAESVTIAGRVDGDVLARRELELTASAKLNGAVTTPQLKLAPGAVLKGQCIVG